MCPVNTITDSPLLPSKLNFCCGRSLNVVHLSYDRREEILDIIKKAHIELLSKNCAIFGVTSKDLKPYTTTEGDMKKQFSRMTPPENRMITEDLLSVDAVKQATDGMAKVSVSSSSTKDDEDYDQQQNTRQAQRAANDNMTFEDEDEEDSKFNGDEMDDKVRASMAGGGKNLFSRNEIDAKLEDFELRKLIGKGTFGKVFLVEHKTTGKLYAMKCIRKDIIIENEQMENIQLEKDILYTIDHPFLVNMEYVFQNDYRIYFLMHFVKGGELFRHLVNVKKFPEDQAKFFAAQVAMALAHLHSKKIIYRDLKPENVLVGEDGKFIFILSCLHRYYPNLRYTVLTLRLLFNRLLTRR